MGKEHVVDIKGNRYRYTYDSTTKSMRYLGPVGDAPSMNEEEFLDVTAWDITTAQRFAEKFGGHLSYVSEKTEDRVHPEHYDPDYPDDPLGGFKETRYEIQIMNPDITLPDGRKVEYLTLLNLESMVWGGGAGGVEYEYNALFEDETLTLVTPKFRHRAYGPFKPETIKTDIIERSWDDFDIPETGAE